MTTERSWPYVDSQLSLATCDSPSKEMASSAQSKGKYETLLVTTEDKITKIIFNRPDKKNCYQPCGERKQGKQTGISKQSVETKIQQMYGEIMRALEEAAKDDSTLTVITGRGDYYCSGNDLNNFAENFSLEKSTGSMVVFETPFSLLGKTPEGCSTYTFPKIMGPIKANEMLLFNKRITANETRTQGLVTEVFADSTFQQEVWTRLKAYANLPRNVLTLSKQLMRSVEKEKLCAVNSRECDQLVERCFSDECMNAVTSFFQKKSKL
ncbi:enoyl-CoA delta isomerase 2-like [Podarcis raffonei]|uniref:enoyl-CoA delta isomerase 2-like n=1 Tax=Podarcis raffonei TaxID=65483 RepID=UPI002329224D|nr:enoyl-CoA delta isomerase 2-like [Podarcis raffonei]